MRIVEAPSATKYSPQHVRAQTVRFRPLDSDEPLSDEPLSDSYGRSLQFALIDFGTDYSVYFAIPSCRLYFGITLILHAG